MGAWSEDAFGNDDACDWTSEFEAAADKRDCLAATFHSVLAEDEYLEVYLGASGVAAAETVARLHVGGGKRNSYSEEIDRWVEGQSEPPSPELLELARKTCDRVRGDDSELLELWNESDGAEWHRQMNELKQRLNAPPSAHTA